MKKYPVVAVAVALVAAVILTAPLDARAPIPNHLPTVKAARALYTSLNGPLRAYCIVNKTAWDLRSEGAGSFFKDSGSAYLQRSLDIVIYKPAGETFDILGDSENTATPQWGRTSPTGFGDVAKWRAPIDPATLSICGAILPPVEPPVEPPVPPTSDLAKLTVRVTALEQQVTQLTNRVLSLEQQQYRVKGNTVIAWGHSHAVDMPVTIVIPSRNAR
jgi:hypothetical protein